MLVIQRKTGKEIEKIQLLRRASITIEWCVSWYFIQIDGNGNGIPVREVSSFDILKF